MLKYNDKIYYNYEENEFLLRDCLFSRRTVYTVPKS